MKKGNFKTIINSIILSNYSNFKSESSLTDKMVSSDGFSTSRSSSSTMSILSSNFQETQPYKPEFLKYLESNLSQFNFKNKLNQIESFKDKSKTGYSSETGDALKPEDDILYQWRLRRKLEEAKKLNHFEINKPDLIQPKPVQQQEAKQLPLKQSMQTQTNNFCDSAVQTSLESIRLTPRNNKPKSLDEIEIVEDNEKPTRDVSSLNTTLIDENRALEEIQTKTVKINDLEKIAPNSKKKPEQAIKPLGTPKKSNFLSSSPIRTKSRYLIDSTDLNPLSSNSLKSMNNMSADLTKVSSLNDNTTNLQKTASSPIYFNQQKLIKKQSQTTINTTTSSNLYSVSASSMTTVTASTDSKISQLSPTNNLDKTVVICNDNSNKKNDSNSSKSYSVNGEDFNADNDEENEYIQKEMIESDEILRILLKKTYFYRLKLK